MAELLTLKLVNNRYWYKPELIRLCLELEILSHGTKAELEERIRSYLKTGKQEMVTPRSFLNTQRLKNTKDIPMTLETRLIPDGFRFNQTSRTFFSDYFGVKRFKFTKEMASAVREAERRGDNTMIVSDLIDVYKTTQQQKKEGCINADTPDEKSLQWNQFVKDFSKDSRTSRFPNRLKVAAILWKTVRESQGTDRTYRSELLDDYLSQG